MDFFRDRNERIIQQLNETLNKLQTAKQYLKDLTEENQPLEQLNLIKSRIADLAKQARGLERLHLEDKVKGARESYTRAISRAYNMLANLIEPSDREDLLEYLNGEEKIHPATIKRLQDNLRSKLRCLKCEDCCRTTTVIIVAGMFIVFIAALLGVRGGNPGPIPIHPVADRRITSLELLKAELDTGANHYQEFLSAQKELAEFDAKHESKRELSPARLT